ncbi:MAG: hypothetical protein IJ657_00805 [Acidaminococcaceae bacterium]|nr:hypothetical protein [Acidaminococcaceae bacterium]
MGDKVMLIDYFERAVGTPEEAPYYELVLYQHNETELLLERYANGGTPEETVTTFHVPAEVYEKVMQIIQGHDMASWNSHSDCFALDGKLYVCKFQDGERFIRVSSDAMPEDGQTAFHEIRSLLNGYTQEKYLVLQ